MTLVLGFPDGGVGDESMRLKCANRPPVAVEAIDGESDIFDHVVTSLADLPAPSGGYIDLTDGSWFIANDLDLGTDVLRVDTGQTVYLRASQTQTLTGAGTEVVRVSGVLLAEQLRIMSSAGQRCVAIETGADFVSVQCTYISPTSNCVVVEGSPDYVAIWGGAMSGLRGVFVSGGAGIGDISLTGITCAATNSFLARNSGICEVVLVRVCNVTAPTGISWAAAAIPTRGLGVVSNQLNCATPISGHTVASARVNYKANLTAGALLSETPIVP